MKDKAFLFLLNFLLVFSILGFPLSFLAYVIFERGLINSSVNPFNFLAYGLLLTLIFLALYFILSKTGRYRGIEERLEKENFYDCDLEITKARILSLSYKSLNLSDDYSLYVKEEYMDKDSIIMSFVLFIDVPFRKKDFKKAFKEYYKGRENIRHINGLVCKIEERYKVKKDYFDYDSSLKVLSHYAFCFLSLKDNKIYFNGDRLSKKRYLILKLIDQVFGPDI